jgi:superfamily II DNA or RNA helicase
VKVGATIKLDYAELTRRQMSALKRELTFATPSGDVVTCYRDVITGGYMRIPRGARYLLNGHPATDVRSKPPMPKLHFTVKLDDTSKSKRFGGQSDAVKAMFKNEQGQIVRPPGTGKTQIALKFIAECETRTLVLVHTKDILKQWVEYAEKAIPGIEIGVIGGGKVKIGHLTIATVQTIKRFAIPGQKEKKFWRQFGCVIVDEGHHGAAKTWEMILNCCPAFYRFSFTASPTRADGLHPALKFVFGPIIHRQKFSSPIPLHVEPIRTQFYYAYRGKWDWTRMIDKLITDEARNRQIAEVIDREASSGNSVLVLSRRIEHLEKLSEATQCNSEILTGARRDSDRERVLAAFRKGTVQVLFATQLADEALDIPRLNRVLLTHPGKAEGRLIQQIGRAIREHVGKEDAVIYDFIDWRIGVLRRQWSQRRRAYKQNRITIRQRRRLKWR